MAQYDKLISSARNLADMITLCERIEWGQDSAKLHECADALEALQAENKKMHAALTEFHKLGGVSLDELETVLQIDRTENRGQDGN